MSSQLFDGRLGELCSVFFCGQHRAESSEKLDTTALLKGCSMTRPPIATVVPVLVTQGTQRKRKTVQNKANTCHANTKEMAQKALIIFIQNEKE